MRSVIVSQNYYLNQILDVHPLWWTQDLRVQHKLNYH